MASADAQPPPAEPAAALPDYLTDPDAVLKDTGVKWRYGRAPDYSKTRAVYAQTKQMNHEAGSLIQLVENLVKNWEVEASFKPRLEDWRTVDHANYTFAINGQPPQSAEHMLKVGTYNAIIAPNEYYSPEHSDFASSHKTFKRMMPTFAWEVIEVYSGPPHVSFRWRHWGTMKNDYVGFNDKGEKVTAKAHGGSIDIQGVTVATVNDKVQLQRVETWFDPMEMFRQIAPQGIVNKEPVARRVSRTPTPLAKTATPEVPSQSEEATDVLQPVAYKPTDGGAVQPPQMDGTVLRPAEKQLDADKHADVRCPVSRHTGDLQHANSNLPSSVPRTEKQPAPSETAQASGLPCEADEQHQASSTQVVKPWDQHSESQPQPESREQPPTLTSLLTKQLQLDEADEFEQWHEASDMVDTAQQGWEPEKFHDAHEVDYGNSTASSEAGSWTAVTPPASDPPTPRTSTYSSSINGAAEPGQSSQQTSPTSPFFQCPAHSASFHGKDMDTASDSLEHVTSTGTAPADSDHGVDVEKVATGPEHGQSSGQHSPMSAFFGCPAHRVHPYPKDMEKAVGPEPGEGVAAAPDSREAQLTYLEMSKITPMECPFLMNRE